MTDYETLQREVAPIIILLADIQPQLNCPPEIFVDFIRKRLGNILGVPDIAATVIESPPA